MEDSITHIIITVSYHKTRTNAHLWPCPPYWSWFLALPGQSVIEWRQTLVLGRRCRGVAAGLRFARSCWQGPAWWTMWDSKLAQAVMWCRVWAGLFPLSFQSAFLNPLWCASCSRVLQAEYVFLGLCTQKVNMAGNAFTFTEKKKPAPSPSHVPRDACSIFYYDFK